MRYWFTSDTHFGHNNIIKHANRPFTSTGEMDAKLVEWWQALIKPEDTVYHLGDVGICSPGYLNAILNKLPGKIHLIEGNHDKTARKCRNRFLSITPMLDIRIPDPECQMGYQPITLCHYGMRTWNKRSYGAWHLYGHSHGKLPDIERSCDVGVDCWEYRPVSYEELKLHFSDSLLSRSLWTQEEIEAGKKQAQEWAYMFERDGSK